VEAAADGGGDRVQIRSAPVCLWCIDQELSRTTPTHAFPVVEQCLVHVLVQLALGYRRGVERPEQIVDGAEPKRELVVGRPCVFRSTPS
jgi:hypothetical protein